jgi:hypothetical protein
MYTIIPSYQVHIYKARTPMAMTSAPLTKIPEAAPVLWGRAEEADALLLALALATTLEAARLALAATEPTAEDAAPAADEATAAAEEIAALGMALAKPAAEQMPAAAGAISVKDC